MCHHYIGVRNRPAHLVDEFSVRTNLYQLTLPDEGFYPLAHVPIVRLNDAGEREAAPAEWGFLPGWWKPSDRTPARASFQRKCINARCEDVEVKPTYRDSFRRRRCLLPAEEFFERGHYFHLADRRPFAFAGLWDRWHDADGSILETCTLLTTEANAAVAAVGHPRMPVIFFDEADYSRWLNGEITERPPLEGLLQPTLAELWRSYAAPYRPRATPSSDRAADARRPRTPDTTQGRLFD